jgi:hypothetical protein
MDTKTTPKEAGLDYVNVDIECDDGTVLKAWDMSSNEGKGVIVFSHPLGHNKAGYFPSSESDIQIEV